MTDLVRTKLGYRVCDWTGNTIIENLPHLHQSTWTINGMQQGTPGSVAIGNFNIPLYPPRSQEYAQNKGIYDKLIYGARVEAYILSESGEYAFGMTPVFSGIITKLNRVLDTFEIQGFDSLWWGQQTVMYPGMNFVTPVPGGGQLLQFFSQIDNLIIADDFAGNRFPANITWSTLLGSGFSQVTDDNLPAWSNSVVNVESELGTTIAVNPINSLFNLADVTVVTAWFHVSNITTISAQESDVSLILSSDATAQNLLLARCVMTGNGTTYDISAQLWHKSSGSYTQDLNIPNIFTGLTGDRRIQLIAILTSVDSTDFSVRLLVNGKDSNCVFTYNQTLYKGANKYWGWRWFQSPSSSATATFTRFYIKTRANLLVFDPHLTQPAVQPFKSPLAISGNSTINLTSINTLTMIDLWSLGTTLENFIWRKDCTRFIVEPINVAFGDTIIWGTQGVSPGAGSDLSASIVLDETVNIVSGGQVANAESLGTEVRIGFDPSPDSDGTIFWPDVHGMLTLGQAFTGSAPMILTDSVSFTGLHDVLIARRLGETTGAKKALTASGSKQFTILRDPIVATPQFLKYNIGSTQFSALSINAFRELDFITLNAPSLGIFNQKVSIQGYTFHENSPLLDVTLDQFSFRDKALLDRRRFNNLDSTFLTFTPRA